MPGQDQQAPHVHPGILTHAQDSSMVTSVNICTVGRLSTSGTTNIHMISQEESILMVTG
jgi:hypothetical protein